MILYWLIRQISPLLRGVSLLRVCLQVKVQSEGKKYIGCNELSVSQHVEIRELSLATQHDPTAEKKLIHWLRSFFIICLHHSLSPLLKSKPSASVCDPW